MAETLEIEKRRTNLLSPVYRFVVPSFLPNESFFQLPDLINKIKEAEGFPPDIENYPFGIITVLGSDKNHTRKIYSDWLIQHFESYGKTSNTVIGPHPDLKHIEIANDASPGIYIWPRKYAIHSKDNLAMVVLIIHVNGNSEALENFAAVASSNIFVFREREKEKLWSRVKNTFIKAATTPGTISVHWSTYLSEIVDKNEAKAAKEFFKYLDGCTIETVKQSDGTDILFKDILLHFKNVESKTNASAITYDQVVADQGHITTIKTLPETNLDTELKNPNSGNQIPPVSLSVTKVCESATQETTSNIDAEKRIPAVQCSQSCVALQKQIEIVLDAWLSKYLLPTNITDMLKCCFSYKPSDDHNVFGELCSLVGIISVYNSQLGNTFDNYVCFAGEEDKNQFHRLAESASRQALKTLQSKKFVHIEFTEKLLHTATVTLHAYYSNENKAIGICETQLTKKLLVTLQLEYKDKMTKYFTSPSTRASIKDIHVQVKARILSMAEKVMNFNEKFCYIFRKYFDIFSSDLNKKFLCLTREYPAELKPKGTLSELNFYIDKYLKQFYTDSLPPLHMLTSEQIIEHHNKVISSVTSDIEWERRETLLNRLYTHVVYVTEIAEQQQDIINLTAKTKSNEGSFCLYLTSDWYTLQRNTRTGMETIQYGKQKCKTPPAEAALTLTNQVILSFKAVELVKKSHSSLKIHGKLLELICNSIKDDHEASYLIVEFFKKVKHDVDTCFEGNFISAIIIIPAWVNVQHRLRMRNLARCAGIKKLFLVNENTLLAYTLLCFNEQEQTKVSTKPEFVITVQVGDSGISVDVFTLKNESQIYQAAVTFSRWQVANPVHDGVWNALNPFQGKPEITNPFSQTCPSSDCIGTLQKAFQNSYSQMCCSLENRFVNFCVISEHPDNEHMFNDFFNEFKTWTKIQNFQFDYVLPAATLFLESPQDLAPSVLSHATSVKYFDVIRQTYLQNYLLVNASCAEMENQSLPLISKEKSILLEKCNKMRDQLSNGSVKVRKLMQKVILECIERAEKAASDVHTTNDMVCLEDEELNELIEEHKFKI